MIQVASLASDARLVRETARVYVAPAPAPERESPRDTDRIEALE